MCKFNALAYLGWICSTRRYLLHFNVYLCMNFSVMMTLDGGSCRCPFERALPQLKTVFGSSLLNPEVQPFVTGYSKCGPPAVAASKWNYYDKWHQWDNPWRCHSMYSTVQKWLLCYVSLWWKSIFVQHDDIQSNEWFSVLIFNILIVKQNSKYKICNPFVLYTCLIFLSHLILLMFAYLTGYDNIYAASSSSNISCISSARQ